MTMAFSHTHIRSVSARAPRHALFLLVSPIYSTVLPWRGVCSGCAVPHARLPGLARKFRLAPGCRVEEQGMA